MYPDEWKFKSFPERTKIHFHWTRILFHLNISSWWIEGRYMEQCLRWSYNMQDLVKLFNTMLTNGTVRRSFISEIDT